VLHKIHGAALDLWILFNWLGKIDLKFFLNPKLPKLFQTKPYRCRAGVEKEDPVPDLPLTARATMGYGVTSVQKQTKGAEGR
jgi:hypothetical protein